MPKFVIELDMEEYDILRDYYNEFKYDSDLASIEGSIVYGIVSQLFISYEKEPEFYYDTTEEV
jgi:hypothetical protein|tara:strand:+ start:64 stop:252 length:189 start_codon:yes stop_codon:yes gene_type:complete